MNYSYFNRNQMKKNNHNHNKFKKFNKKKTKKSIQKVKMQIKL